MSLDGLRDLPHPRPQGDYVSASRTGDYIITAGMTPRVDGEMAVKGRLGGSVNLELGKEGARIAARNALGALKSESSLKSIELVRLIVYINATADFTEHSVVADAATLACVEVLGTRGRCARAAIGVSSLPGGACVELELVARVTNQ